MKQLCSAFLCVTVSFFAACAAAQTWPERPVKMIIPTPVGSAPDIAGRVLADKLSGMWEQPVFVENRAGAGGITAASAFVRSPADGYTLGFLHAAVIGLTPHLFKNPQFNVDTDLQTVATVVSGSMVVVVNPRLGVSTLPELIALAKARPEEVVFAAPLLNSVPHLTGEMLFRAAGIQVQTVPYNGSAAAVTAMLSNEGADVIVDSPAPLMPFIEAGKMTPIAVTSPTRFQGLSNVPTIGETLPGFEASGWFALFAPAKTPSSLLEKINQDVQTAIQLPDVAAKFVELGLYSAPKSVAASTEFIDKDRDRWAKLIQEMDITPQ